MNGTARGEKRAISPGNAVSGTNRRNNRSVVKAGLNRSVRLGGQYVMTRQHIPAPGQPRAFPPGLLSWTMVPDPEGQTLAERWAFE